MYYKVKDKIPRRLPDHHLYGYETMHLFEDAIYKLHKTWNGHTGKCMEERQDFRKLRFYNAYRNYQDVWFPLFMLSPTPPPAEEQNHKQQDQVEEFLDQVYGFD